MKTTEKTKSRLSNNDTVPDLTIAVSSPPVHPLRLRNLARRWWVRERAIKRLEKQVSEIKTELKPLLPLGETKAGSFKILKTHIDQAYVPAFVRAAYDTIKVSETI